MNLKEAALQLAVHYQTAYRWIRDGELIAVKVGNRYEISESAVERFLSRRASLIAEPLDRPLSSLPSIEATIDEIAELRVLARETLTTASSGLSSNYRRRC